MRGTWYLGLAVLLIVGAFVAIALPGLFSQAAYAAPATQQCPEGTVMSARPYLGPTGAMQQNVGCYPPPPPPRPPFRYSYAALSYDSTAHKWSAGLGARSQGDARRDAIEACRKNGGQNCRIMLGFSNQCAAVARAIDGGAAIPGNDSVNTGASIVKAEVNAAQSCRADWKVGMCAVILSDCSLHSRRW